MVTSEGWVWLGNQWWPVGGWMTSGDQWRLGVAGWPVVSSEGWVTSGDQSVSGRLPGDHYWPVVTIVHRLGFVLQVLPHNTVTFTPALLPGEGGGLDGCSHVLPHSVPGTVHSSSSVTAELRHRQQGHPGQWCMGQWSTCGGPLCYLSRMNCNHVTGMARPNFHKIRSRRGFISLAKGQEQVIC